MWAPIEEAGVFRQETVRPLNVAGGGWNVSIELVVAILGKATDSGGESCVVLDFVTVGKRWRS